MSGALRLVRTNKISTRMALVGEPSGLQLITAGKGLAQVEIEFPIVRKKFNIAWSIIFVNRQPHKAVFFMEKPPIHQHLFGESAIKKMMAYLPNSGKPGDYGDDGRQL